MMLKPEAIISIIKSVEQFDKDAGDWYEKEYNRQRQNRLRSLKLARDAKRKKHEMVNKRARESPSTILNDSSKSASVIQSSNS